MHCPKCHEAGVESDVPAVAKANVCPDCGWLELVSVAVGSDAAPCEKIFRADTEQKPDVSGADWPERRRCLLCGQSRDLLDSKGIKVITGHHGGVCENCVALCQEIIASEKGRVAPL